MYGLLIDAICESLKLRYGEQVLVQIQEKASIHQTSFTPGKMYSESVIYRLTKAAQEVTGTPLNELMGMFGEAFVPFVDTHGYGRILKVLGRNMRDFLNGLDNLHEYIRFTYPKLKPPSFFCESESKSGLTLHYRSRRKGFLHYVMGQIRAVGERYYKTHVDIDIVKEEETLDITHVIMRLHFDNRAFDMVSNEDPTSEKLCDLQIHSQAFFEVFPFHMVFNKLMTIQSAGSGLLAVIPYIKGESVDEVFSLVRPLVAFSLANVLMYSNNVFELVSVDPIQKVSNVLSETGDQLSEQDAGSLRLKGQMLYMDQWDAIVFLGTPLMENLTRMFETGLYLNDLSMHDSSRDLVFAATQQSSELKMALDQEKVKSRKLEDSMRSLDEEMKRTDVLLYQMIPKTVADRLRNGEPAVNTCEVFENVTILFSDVVGFTRICSQLTPMAVVAMLNGMYTKFDRLSDKHRVYKVETIGDAYMVVSGAPTVTKFHAIRISEMAMDMLSAMSELVEPSSGKTMQIRVGLHSGTVVAGVVGLKMPRYCLFGETVNIASKMENNGQAMRIHVSEATKVHLVGQGYTLEERGLINIQELGEKRTYWLTGKKANRKGGVSKDMEGLTDVADLPTIIETDTANGRGEHSNVLYKPNIEITSELKKTSGQPGNTRDANGARHPSGTNNRDVMQSKQTTKVDRLEKPAKTCALM